MSPLNRYFDKIYCINLAKRADRWAECLTEFAKHGLEVVRVEAVDGTTVDKIGVLNHGETGCYISHANVLLDIINNNVQRALVLEDDVVFVQDLNDRFEAAVPNLPGSWDMLYLGGNHVHEMKPVNGVVSKLVKTYTTSSYGVSFGMAQKLQSKIGFSLAQIDVFYAAQQFRSRCYGFTTVLAWQRPGISDIHGVYTDYTSDMGR